MNMPHPPTASPLLPVDQYISLIRQGVCNQRSTIRSYVFRTDHPGFNGRIKVTFDSDSSSIRIYLSWSYKKSPFVLSDEKDMTVRSSLYGYHRAKAEAEDFSKWYRVFCDSSLELCDYGESLF